jgi:hypothetical protein
LIHAAGKELHAQEGKQHQNTKGYAEGDDDGLGGGEESIESKPQRSHVLQLRLVAHQLVQAHDPDHAQH